VQIIVVEGGAHGGDSRTFHALMNLSE
jgi:hypothetical protein